MTAPSVARTQARRLIQHAKSISGRPVIGRVVEGPTGTLALIGVEDPDGAEAMRVHEALIELSRAEGLDVNVIVVAGTDDGPASSRGGPGRRRR
ncbi:MAG: hypothetical protein IT460_06545 [Planctomycetes bacterium]|nr:hypothetical protein [Planctomycetota bacterium]